MKKLIFLASSLSVAVLLVSCGGGGDDAPAATTAPGTSTPVATVGSSAQLSSFAGTWMGCFTEGTSSERETIVFTQLSADTFSVAATSAKYAAAGCAGAVTRTSSDSGTVTFTGTKTIGAETVNKIIFTEPGRAPTKKVALVKGSNPVTLTFGKNAEDGGVLDSEGYPATLESNRSGIFTKQ